ncbi:rhodanese-like domain-containing protein [Microbacterium sp. C7(2022)]|uniref:rhodanese-like domain-containing protein n=1 Tax=Microbacterium sp. C7(2022) TaxID=2992759 RepID=UPI00237C097C|nr:rhodanese-like domain-containing protein [Microbacterium sp. C7(2022)]MDE0546218.1 rhodanese-like domain-containing protein [Microbacterium sp. C7(2022)]
MMLGRARSVAALAAALVAATTLAGCAPAEPIALDDDTVIVDVRTPAEYAAGHLEGAVNIDLRSEEFEGEIAQLDDEATYVVYCQSGNRSGQAAAIMEGIGLDVVDAGSLAEAETATGLPRIP